MQLKDKVAIVTGASSGIGRAIALAYAREGARVAHRRVPLHEVPDHADGPGRRRRDRERRVHPGCRRLANAPAYTAAKHGVLGLTKTAALEYGTQGVRINALGPASTPR